MKYKKNFQTIFPKVFDLNGSVQQVYLYLAYQYCLQERDFFKITYEEIRKGTLIDNGTGLSLRSIGTAIQTLKELNLIQIAKNHFSDRLGDLATIHHYLILTPNKTENNDQIEFKNRPKNEEIQQYKNCICKICTCKNYHVEIEPQRCKICSHLIINIISSVFSEEQVLEKDKKLDEKRQPKTTGFFDKPTSQHLSNDNPTSIATSLLWNALGKRNKLGHSSSQRGWDSTFKKHLAHDRLDQVRFFKVLRWYCENIGGKYIPSAFSAKSFCEKFVNIEDAMERIQAEQTDTQKNHWTFDDVLPPEEEAESKLEKEQDRIEDLIDRI